MFRTICFAILIFIVSSAGNAQETQQPQRGATPPLSIDIVAITTANDYASVAMYRWDAARQVGVRMETYAIPAYPMIPVDPPGSGGGYIDPNSAEETDRDSPLAIRGTTSFPPIIVRGHRWWPSMMRIGYTLIDSYERLRAVHESNLAQCARAQLERDFLQCDADDGDEPPQLDCGAAPNGFVAAGAPAAAGMFASSCGAHASCIRQVGASRSNCASALRTASERQCDTFYPTAGFPGSVIPPSEYQILNEGCRLQAMAYSVQGIGDAGLVAFDIWLERYSNPALGDPITVDNLPVSDANWDEAQHRARCKDAADRESRFCL